MLTAKIDAMKVSNPNGNLAVAFGLVTALLLLLGKVATQTMWPSEARPVVPSTAKLGHAFLGEYLLPFEIGSVVLLAALIGAVVLARRAVKRTWEKE
jgi:NADH-quinone oxidoreductase subunit J